MAKKWVLDEDLIQFNAKNNKKRNELESKRFILRMEALKIGKTCQTDAWGGRISKKKKDINKSIKNISIRFQKRERTTSLKRRWIISGLSKIPREKIATNKKR